MLIVAMLNVFMLSAYCAESGNLIVMLSVIILNVVRRSATLLWAN
jgi:hypothetical protein